MEHSQDDGKATGDWLIWIEKNTKIGKILRQNLVLYLVVTFKGPKR